MRSKSVNFPKQNGDVEGGGGDRKGAGPGRGVVVPRGTGVGRGQPDTVITASTWLSNILPTPREEGGSGRDQSPSPQHKELPSDFDCNKTENLTINVAIKKCVGPISV